MESQLYIITTLELTSYKHIHIMYVKTGSAEGFFVLIYYKSLYSCITKYLLYSLVVLSSLQWTYSILLTLDQSKRVLSLKYYNFLEYQWYPYFLYPIPGTESKVVCCLWVVVSPIPARWCHNTFKCCVQFVFAVMISKRRVRNNCAVSMKL